MVPDDVDLDRDGDGINIDDPNPNQYDTNLVEKQAYDAEISPQDAMRQMDWGSPGKQHGPDLVAPNDSGEMNAYDD